MFLFILFCIQTFSIISLRFSYLYYKTRVSVCDFFTFFACFHVNVCHLLMFCMCFCLIFFLFMFSCVMETFMFIKNVCSISHLCLDIFDIICLWFNNFILYCMHAYEFTCLIFKLMYACDFYVFHVICSMILIHTFI